MVSFTGWLLAGLLLAGTATAQSPVTPEDTERSRWTDFRGPHQNGHVPGSAPPLLWSETENVVWKTPVHGRAWSTPVVWDGLVWMTTATADGKELSVICVDHDSGEVLHDFVLFENDKPQFVNALNSHASPSPVIEDGRVYVHFGAYGTAAVDTDSAAVVWQRRDLHCEHLMGPGSSPVLYGDLVIFHVDGADRQYVIALDKETGETAWRTDRSTDFTGVDPDFQKAYGTPLVEAVDGRDQLISVGAQCTFAYEPTTGHEIWAARLKGFSQSSRPVTGHGMVFLSTGFNKARMAAVRLGGKGDVTHSHVVWQYTRNVPTMSSPILVEDRLYFVGDSGGLVTCLDVNAGEALFRERIGGEHCASPVLAGGRLYFFDREGEAVVLAPGREFEVLARNHLDDGFMASPVVLGDGFLLRGKTHLYRIEEVRDGAGEESPPEAAGPLETGAPAEPTATPDTSAAPEPAIVVLEPPEQGFFSKQVTMQGVPIKAHQVVEDRALFAAHETVRRMLARAPTVLSNLVAAGAELHILGRDQKTSDLPEHRTWKEQEYRPGMSFDARYPRGKGGLRSSCGEENLLGLTDDPYHGQDMCVHEFAHTIHVVGLSLELKEAIRRCFARSVWDQDRWYTAYASTNEHEYFAELSTWYFGSHGDRGDLSPPPRDGPEWLRSYDPEAYELIDAIYSGAMESAPIERVRLYSWARRLNQDLYSSVSTRPSSILFHNQTDFELLIHWVSSKGTQRLYGVVLPGSTYLQECYSGQTWLVEYLDQSVHSIYRARREPGTALLQALPR